MDAHVASLKHETFDVHCLLYLFFASPFVHGTTRIANVFHATIFSLFWEVQGLLVGDPPECLGPVLSTVCNSLSLFGEPDPNGKGPKHSS